MLGVVKIGSSLFSDPSKSKLDSLKKFISTFNGNLVFVTGAGSKYKDVLKDYRQFGFSEGFLDHLGMELTHVNAQAIARLIGGVYCKRFEDIEKFKLKNPVTGGQIPGQSTDAVAAELADFLGADVLIYTKDVGGIFTADPKEDAGARIIHKLSFDELPQFIKRNTKAGSYGVLDSQAIHVIMRSRIKTHVTGPNFDLANSTLIE